MDINTVTRSIMFGDWTNKEINDMIEAIKYARTRLATQTKNSISVGSAVKFTDRSGKTYQGTVTKIMQKNAVVKTMYGNYRVPANMLEQAVGIGEVAA